MEEVSIVYELDDELKIEKVDAIKLGEHYQIKAVPAFATKIAYDDIVSVESEDGHLFFTDIVNQSGHSVVRIIVIKSESSTLVYARLISMGLKINYLNKNRYLVLDVPTEQSIVALKEVLDHFVEAGDIDYEMACISDWHYKELET